jgi:hypothetical protein
MRKELKILSEKLKREAYLGDLGADGRFGVCGLASRSQTEGLLASS